jgi:hypothetical protein
MILSLIIEKDSLEAYNRLDLTGKSFGRLTVLAYDCTIGKKAYWKCQCDCGNIRIVSRNCLRQGQTKSCGCLRNKFYLRRET